LSPKISKALLRISGAESAPSTDAMGSEELSDSRMSSRVRNTTGYYSASFLKALECFEFTLARAARTLAFLSSESTGAIRMECHLLAFDGKILKIPIFFKINLSPYAIFSDNSVTIALANRQT
jgi:hypothetical protein